VIYEMIAGTSPFFAGSHDNKVAQGELTLMLPAEIGSVVTRNDLPEAAVRDSVRELIRGSRRMRSGCVGTGGLMEYEEV
jgi:hypothetical protein